MVNQVKRPIPYGIKYVVAGISQPGLPGISSGHIRRDEVTLSLSGSIMKNSLVSGGLLSLNISQMQS